MNHISVKRVYDDYSADDGYRILVDRLWPRGMRKEKIRLDRWAKEISPSTELRKSFRHTADTMEAFKQKYVFELDQNEQAPDFLALVKNKLAEGNVTLLYAAKDTVNNHANVLKGWIEERLTTIV